MRKDPARPSWADVTPKHLFLNRRALIGGALALGVAAPAAAKIAARPSPYSMDAAPNSYEQITGYNNYYEFGWDKGDPAKRLIMSPTWSPPASAGEFGTTVLTTTPPSWGSSQ